jgi:hypothetical protein
VLCPVCYPALDAIVPAHAARGRHRDQGGSLGVMLDHVDHRHVTFTLQLTLSKPIVHSGCQSWVQHDTCYYRFCITPEHAVDCGYQADMPQDILQQQRPNTRGVHCLHAAGVAPTLTGTNCQRFFSCHGFGAEFMLRSCCAEGQHLLCVCCNCRRARGTPAWRCRRACRLCPTTASCSAAAAGSTSSQGPTWAARAHSSDRCAAAL